jgi:hypothetical protein
LEIILRTGFPAARFRAVYEFILNVNTGLRRRRIRDRVALVSLWLAWAFSTYWCC